MLLRDAWLAFQVAYAIGRKLVWGDAALRKRPLSAFTAIRIALPAVASMQQMRSSL